jgi:hypothetical protein
MDSNRGRQVVLFAIESLPVGGGDAEVREIQ